MTDARVRGRRERGGAIRGLSLVAALLPLSTSTLFASTPNMVCKGTASVVGDGTPQPPQQRATTDIFRVAGGRLYHSWRGREEYLYNDISEVGFRRYASGHMLFVMDTGSSQRGYVVIAAPTDWRVVYLDCRS